MQTHTIPTPIQVVRRTAAAPNAKLRWAVADVGALFELPFNAQTAGDSGFEPETGSEPSLLPQKSCYFNNS